MEKRSELAGQGGGAEAPEIPADDHAVRPAAKRDQPAAAGPIAVVVLLVEFDADLVAVGSADA